MSRSLINTSLFMNPSNSFTSSDETVSSDNEHEASYVKVSDEEDLYIIHTSDKKFYLYRQRLLNTVRELHAYANVQITQLEEEQTKLLESTIEATRILYNSNVLKKLILDDIQEIFKDVKNPTPGSVSAFFLACFNNDNFQGPLGCNPRCAASSLGCDTFNCADTILVYSNRQFNALNDKQTSHAYIYIESDKFTAFQHKDVEQLKDAHISSVTLIYGNKNGTYREITYKMSLDQLPTSNNTTTASSGTIVLIIIIMFIILALVFLYGNGYLDSLFI